MSDVLELNEFRFFLNFKNDNSFGRIEITEPIGFDVANFVVEQDDDRYGRDVYYGSRDINLEFIEAVGQIATNPVTLPNGVIINHLTMGLPFLLEYHKIYGSESEVEFIVNRNGVDFTVGLCDFATSETDRFSYFRCIIIQNTDYSLIKRRSDVEFNVFATEDLDGNPIEPVQTSNILLKAKPIVQISEWDNFDEWSVTSEGSVGFPGWFNRIKFVSKSQIKNTLSWLNDYYQGLDWQQISNFRIIEAQTLLTNVVCTLNLKMKLEYIQIGGPNSIQIAGYIFLGHPTTIESDFTNNAQPFYTSPLLNASNPVINIDQEFNVNFSEIEAGKMLFFVFLHLSDGNDQCLNTFYESKLNISATSNEIDSVVTCVRHIDFMKQISKGIGQYEVIAPKYDVGGAFYDNFVFNGYLLRQFTDKPFVNNFKSVIEQLAELNSDYQVLPNRNLFMGQYNDFYPFFDLGSYLQIPDTDFEVSFQDRYKFQTFEYKYNKYEQGKDEENTIDAVHTESQFMLPTKQVEGNKSVDVDYIRDAFKIEVTRRKNVVSNSTTSIQEDDDIFIIDVVPLEEGTRSSIKNIMSFQISLNSGIYYIRILASENFSWNLLGFEVTADVIFSFRYNGNDYSFNGTVTEIEPSLVTIDIGSSSLPSGLTVGEYFLFATFDYPLMNVQFVNRTDQEFELIENVENGDNFSNLQYTIRRNMKHWESFIKTASNYALSGIFKNTFFKVNGELITQFRGGEIIKENESVPVSSLNERILTPVLFSTKVFADYENVLTLLTDLNTINDGKIGGYIRIYDNENRVIKVFPKKLDYLWARKELLIEGEELYESDFVSIRKSLHEAGTDNWLLFINQTGYDETIIKRLNYKANGDYLQLFDSRGIPLNNPVRFNYYIVSNQTPTSIIDLCRLIDEL